jgi:hypothetical protein
VTLAEVAGLRAAFATNAAVGVRPISAVDPVSAVDQVRAIDDTMPAREHPVVDALRRAYLELPADRL